MSSQLESSLHGSLYNFIRPVPHISIVNHCFTLSDLVNKSIIPFCGIGSRVRFVVGHLKVAKTKEQRAKSRGRLETDA